jgi:transposase
MKTTLITLFSIKGIVHFKFTPQGQTLNQVYFVEALKRLHDVVGRKGPELWPTDWILHHGNASAHKVLTVKQFLVQKLITETEHPPYSPDLIPNDFSLFPKIKSVLKGQRCQDVEDTQKNVMITLKAIPQQEFQKCFQQC